MKTSIFQFKTFSWSQKEGRVLILEKIRYILWSLECQRIPVEIFKPYNFPLMRVNTSNSFII